jgi:hypothetical protein
MRIQVQKHKKHMPIFVVCFEISKQKNETLKSHHGIPLPPPTQTRKIKTSFTLNWIQTTNNKLRETSVLQAIIDNVNNN